MKMAAVEVATAGINDTVLSSSPQPMLLVPLLMRNRNMSGFPQLLPGATHRVNPHGFAAHSGTQVNFTIIEPGLIQVSMAALGDFTIEVDEEVALVVPFEAIDFCNRSSSDPALKVPATTTLVTLRIVAPEVASKAIVGAASATVATASVMAGDPATASAMQSLAVIGLMRCASTRSQQMMGSVAALGIFNIGDGYPGVINGNLAFISGVAGLQLLALLVALIYHMKKDRTKLLGQAARAACETVLFPSITLIAIQTVFQGTLFAGYQLASTHSDEPGADSHIAYGAVVAVVFTSLPVVYALVSWLLLPRRFSTFHYDYDKIPVWKWPLLQKGEITPMATRRMFGSIVTVSCRKEPAFIAMPMILPVVLSALSVINPPFAGGCVGVFAAATCFFMLFAAVVLYYRPFKAPLVDAFVGFTALTFAGLLIVETASTSVSSASAGSVASKLVFIQTALQISRTFASVAMFAVNRLLGKDLRTETLAWEIVDRWPRQTTVNLAAIASDAAPAMVVADLEAPLLYADGDREMRQLTNPDWLDDSLGGDEPVPKVPVFVESDDSGSDSNALALDAMSSRSAASASSLQTRDIFHWYLHEPESEGSIIGSVPITRRSRRRRGTRSSQSQSSDRQAGPAAEPRKREDEGLFSMFTNMISS